MERAFVGRCYGTFPVPSLHYLYLSPARLPALRRDRRLGLGGGAAAGSAASTLRGPFIVTPATRRNRAAGGYSWTTCSFPVGRLATRVDASLPEHARLHAGGPGVRGDLAGRGWHRPRSE